MERNLNRSWVVPPTLCSKREEFVCFSCDFDSGNCGSVKFVGNWQFQVATVPDCHGTDHETHNRTWFYFSVTNIPENQKVVLTVKNMNNQKSLFGHGYKPVCKSLPNKNGWDRIPGAVSVHAPNKNECSITFSFKFLHGKDEVYYFAFCYPHSYEECQKKLLGLEKRFLQLKEKTNISEPNVDEYDDDDDQTTEETEEEERDEASSSQRTDGKLYFHRELLTYSLQGRRVDLLTITNHISQTKKKKKKLKRERSMMRPLLRQHPYLFPNRQNNHKKGSEKEEEEEEEEEDGCLYFPGKPVVFISSRVHPGETPASFTFNGFLDFILDHEDPRACKLRDMFVFKMVPILNPDGVSLGHYRTNSLGLNLNRFYHAPSPTQHPSIAAVKQLVSFYAHGLTSTNLYLYLDMHAHASKRGCFLYGNYLTSLDDHVQNVAYSRFVALNSPYLDVNGSDFSKKNMATRDKKDQSVSKEGSGRVAIYRDTGIIRCYTLECNYNCGKVINTVYPARKATGGNNRKTKKQVKPSKREPSPERVFPGHLSPNSVYYSPTTWKDVGKACAIAILDSCGPGSNPWSRIEGSPYKSHNNLYLHLQAVNRQNRSKALKSRKIGTKKFVSHQQARSILMLPSV